MLGIQTHKQAENWIWVAECTLICLCFQLLKSLCKDIVYDIQIIAEAMQNIYAG